MQVLGKKITQTQKFLTDGTRIPVTIVAVPDSPVVAIKTQDRDGYTALQLGYGTRKHTNKSLAGHIKGAKLKNAPYLLREVKMADGDVLPAVGDFIKVEEILQPGDIINVTGVSKGKGFAGVVKRHNFRGGPRTHGQSDRERAPGSIGQTTTPGRVYRGKRMAGRMGHEVVTLQNLLVVDVVEKQVLVKGLVPGGVNTMVIITKVGALKANKSVPLQKPATAEAQNGEETQKSTVVEEGK